jgi:hypothetical protein
MTPEYRTAQKIALLRKPSAIFAGTSRRSGGGAAARAARRPARSSGLHAFVERRAPIPDVHDVASGCRCRALRARQGHARPLQLTCTGLEGEGCMSSMCTADCSMLARGQCPKHIARSAVKLGWSSRKSPNRAASARTARGPWSASLCASFRAARDRLQSRLLSARIAEGALIHDDARLS